MVLLHIIKTLPTSVALGGNIIIALIIRKWKDDGGMFKSMLITTFWRLIITALLLRKQFMSKEMTDRPTILNTF